MSKYTAGKKGRKMARFLSKKNDELQCNVVNKLCSNIGRITKDLWIIIQLCSHHTQIFCSRTFNSLNFSDCTRLFICVAYTSMWIVVLCLRTYLSTIFVVVLALVKRVPFEHMYAIKCDVNVNIQEKRESGTMTEAERESQSQKRLLIYFSSVDCTFKGTCHKTSWCASTCQP